MEEDQLPGRTDSQKRSFSDVVCDCGVSTCCGFTLIIYLFLHAWSTLVKPITPELLTATLIPFVELTIIVLIIWLIYKVYSRQKRRNH